MSVSVNSLFVFNLKNRERAPMATNSINNKHARYAYFKNGDVVLGLRTFGNKPTEVPNGGPVAFFADFLNMAYPNRVLMLCFGSGDLEETRENVQARSFRSSASSNGFLDSQFRLLRASVQCLVCLWKFRPNRLLCGSIGVPLWLLFSFTRLFRTPFVHSLHTNISDSRNNKWHFRLRRTFDRYCIRRADAVICHGPFLEQQLLEMGIPRHKVTAFDTGFAELVAQAKSTDETGISWQMRAKLADDSLLYVGRLVADKGIYDLLEAALPLLRSNSSLQLIYIGAGDDQDELARRIAKTDCTTQVYLAGSIDHRQLGGIIKRARVMVTPTQTTCPEGRCMAAMEGLALGVPVIAPDFGPFPYLIKNNVNGLLYEPDSVEDLGRKLHDLLVDQTLYQRLLAGVHHSQKHLLEPETSFSTAVSRAFSVAAPQKQL